MAGPDPELANLRKIDHIVVLMLENRSFDHMLGYLRLEAARSDVGPANLTDLQEQVLAAKKRIRAEGLPEGQP